MEAIWFLALLAIAIGYFNLYLILKKEKPTIIINNYISDSTKNMVRSIDNENLLDTDEIPIKTNIVIKELTGTANLNNEDLGTVDVSSITNKIKELRKK